MTVSNAYTNIATQISEGIDYTIRYQRDLGPGSMRVNFLATHYLEQSSNLFKDEKLDLWNGTLEYPENTANMELSYTLKAWRFLWGVDWIDGMDSYALLEEDPATYIRDLNVGDYQEHYMSVRYTSDSWQVTGGVRNVFDTEPPMISSGHYSRIGNSPLYSGYDYFGREAFVQAVFRMGGNSRGR